MKKVFLYAYDRNNLGDDLFVYTIANRYPEVKFYLWQSIKNRTPFSNLKNVVMLNLDSPLLQLLKKLRPSLFSKYKGLREQICSVVVFIGGSLFIEYENWNQILNWWEYEASHRKFYVVGANFGPYHTEAYRERISNIYANMKDVCFRDKYSQSLFSDVETVRCAPDILFSYPIKGWSPEKKQVFVSVINCASKDEGANKLSNYASSYINSMVNILTDVIKRGYRIILSSFCKAEGDEKAVETIRSKIQTDLLTVVNYNGFNSQEILDNISESSFIIASRFHAVILGFAAGKPVLPIVYSDKTIHVLEDVGFQGKLIDIRHLEQINICNLLSDPDAQKLNDLDIIKKQSELQFLKLDQVLK